MNNNGSAREHISQKRSFLAVGFVLVIVSSVIQSQTPTNVGTVSAPFLEIEVGSRAIGMGGAFVAVANDATAIYWNPAGLSRLTKTEAVLIHANWLVGTYFDFAGIAIPIGSFGTIGASITTLSTGEMEVRTIQYQEGTGEKFSYGDLAAGLTYAKNLTERLSIGFNGKFISQRIWHMNATGYAIDVGTLFRTQFNGLRIGMSISNFGSSMRLEGKDTSVNYDEAPQLSGSNERIPAFKQTDYFPLPLLFRVGLAMDVLNSITNRLTLAIDATHPNDNTENINLGVEYSLNNFVALRVGYKNMFARDSEEGLTIGGGARLSLMGGIILTVNYSYQDFGRLVNAQSVSLEIEFK